MLDKTIGWLSCTAETGYIESVGNDKTVIKCIRNSICKDKVLFYMPKMYLGEFHNCYY